MEKPIHRFSARFWLPKRKLADSRGSLLLDSSVCPATQLPLPIRHAENRTIPHQFDQSGALILKTTQVAIVGGGPAGMLLSHILSQVGIHCVVVERRSAHYVQQRIRAGLLEFAPVELLRNVGLGGRMEREGQLHDGSLIVFAGRDEIKIDTRKFAGKPMMAYGQTALTEDLYRANEQSEAILLDECDRVEIQDTATPQPKLTISRHGRTQTLACEYVAGCDGFHGVSRHSMPSSLVSTFERAYPFGWLGVLAKTRPLPLVTYANHARGFALASMRSAELSRLYIQCPTKTNLDDWSAERFFDELRRRFPPSIADQIHLGPVIEKSFAPLRSFVIEPMSHGRLFLVGDAAHIVPPTGAKGLNLAIADVHYLSEALVAHYREQDDSLLESYSATALDRVWKTQRFSWWMTRLLHRFPDDTDLDQRLREAELDYIRGSEHALGSMAEQYVGMPF